MIKKSVIAVVGIILVFLGQALLLRKWQHDEIEPLRADVLRQIAEQTERQSATLGQMKKEQAIPLEQVNQTFVAELASQTALIEQIRKNQATALEQLVQKTTSGLAAQTALLDQLKKDQSAAAEQMTQKVAAGQASQSAIVEQMKKNQAAAMEQWDQKLAAGVAAQVTIIDKMMKNNPSSTLEQLTHTLAFGLAEQNATLERGLKNQLAILERSLGAVTPVQMPADFEQRFKALETQVADKDHWPKTLEDAQKLRSELTVLVKRLPAWAEADYLARLNALQWSLQAFLTLNTYAALSDEQLDQAVADCDRLVANVPDGVRPDLVATLRSAAVELVQRSDARRRKAAMALAIAINEGGAGDALLAWQQLERWETDPLDGPRVTTLRKALHAKVVLREADLRAPQLARQTDRVVALPDLKLRQAGLARLYATAADLWLALAEEGLSSPTLEQVIKKLDGLRAP